MSDNQTEETTSELVTEESFVDESFFTGEEKKEEVEDTGINNMLQEQFSPKQIGSIARYTEPVNGSSPLETALNMFKEDETLRCIPVEEYDHVIGFIDRKTIESVTDSVWKRITANNIIDYTQRVETILYAQDYIEKVLGKVSAINREYGIVYFPVFNSRSFYGMVSLDDFLDRTSDIREQDLDKASMIQESFFPHDDIISQLPYSFHSWNRMANKLGGDMFQIYRFSSSCSLIACFDVSGKNVAASLLTIAVASFFHTFVASNNSEKNPVRFIAMLDHYLESVVPSGNFLTAAFVYVDENAKKICIFNCGHTTIYMLKKDTVGSSKGKIISIQPKLPPLGMGVVHDQLLASLKQDGKDRPYVAYNLTHGLHVELYSDGLTDMKSEVGKRYEDERTKEFFVKLYDKNDDEVEATIEKEVDDWTGKAMLPDDVTVLDVRF